MAGHLNPSLPLLDQSPRFHRLQSQSPRPIIWGLCHVLLEPLMNFRRQRLGISSPTKQLPAEPPLILIRIYQLMMAGMRRTEGQLSDYVLPRSWAEEPFRRTALHTTSDSTFEQYNSATSHAIMGFSSELLKASITVYNRLYLWDYTTLVSFQDSIVQPNNISAVRILSPWPGAFFASLPRKQ